MKKSFLLLVLAGALGPAFAQAPNQEPRYSEVCAKPESEKLCDGLLSAALKRVREKSVSGKKITCVPSKVTNQQALQVVKNYANANPRFAHIETDTLVVAALQEGFPCKDAK